MSAGLIVIYYQDKTNTLYNGSCLDILKTLPENSIDAIITDPPYGIAVFNNQWDKNLESVPAIAFDPATWKEHLRVLKPGGFLVSFSHATTYHHTASAIEKAGFEIRDQLMWIQPNSMPYGKNISKEIDKELKHKGKAIGEKIHRSREGKFERPKTVEILREHSKQAKEWIGWHTRLKGAHEPIVLAQKPLEKTIWEFYQYPNTNVQHNRGSYGINALKWHLGGLNIFATSPRERFTSNIIFQYNELPEILKGAPKFWYTTKADTNDRIDGVGEKRADNFHSTVKPTDLMMWLVRLITPAGGVVLDSFLGSGSTGKAVNVENKTSNKHYKFIGIEKEPKYMELAKARIINGAEYYYNNVILGHNGIRRENENGAISLYDLL